MLFFEDVQVETISFRQSNGGFLVPNDEDIADSSGEGLALSITDVGDIKATQVSFDMHELTNSTDVVSAGDVTEFAWLVLDPGDDFAVLQVVLDGVALVNIGVRESDGSRVVSYNVGDLVGTDGFSLDLEELELGLIFLDTDEGEPSLDIVEHAVVLSGFLDGQDIHDSDWELDVPPDFFVDAESGFFIHGG